MQCRDACEYRWFAGYLYFVAVVFIGGTGWAFMRPIPDWRLHLHTGVLVIAALLPLVAASFVAWRTTWSVLGWTSAIGASGWLSLLALGSAIVWDLPRGATLHVHERSDTVSIERIERWWNSSTGDCHHRAHPVYFGMFIGPPLEGYLPCG